MADRPMIILGGAALALVTLGLHGGDALAYTYTTLYSFTDGSDGGQPIGGVISDATGTLFGETLTGGDLACTSQHYGKKSGCGTLYSFTQAGGLKILADFAGPNGANGDNGLTLAGTKLFGSTSYGGAYDDGVVFSVNTDGTGFTLLHQFSGVDGLQPYGRLVVAPSGILYGVTQSGGSSYPSTSYGVLFSLTPGGVYTVLHSFNLQDGAQPDALLMSASGLLVGSTFLGGPAESSSCQEGCGTVFSYSLATGQFSSLFAFPSSQNDGEEPFVGSIGLGPTVYGVSSLGIFSLTMPTGLGSLAKFTAETGYGAFSGPLIAPGKFLYGVTSAGPAEGGGTLYNFKNGVLETLFDFGGNPKAQPILTSGGSYIGTTTTYGNCYLCGTIWEYTP